MKVILLRDVAKIGRRFEVKEIPDGHAQNFLIPRKLAEVATPQSLKRLEEMKSKQAAGMATKGAHFAESLARLKVESPTITVEANEKGHLFKGVKADDIAHHLREHGFDIEPRDVKLESPLKEVGTHEITLERKEHRGVITVTLAPST